MEQIYNTVIEALIFSSDEPITSGEIIKAVKGLDGDEVQITQKDIDDCINELNKKYEEQ